MGQAEKETIMSTRVKVMDLELDLLSEEAYQSQMTECLSNDVLKVVHLISLDYLDVCEKNPFVRETMQEADLVLPGEKAILSSCHVDVLETGGMIVDYRTAGKALDPAVLDGKKYYLVSQSKKEAKIVYRYLGSHYPQMEMTGVYAADGEVTEETLINDINTKLPDLIIVSMESPRGEEWIQNSRLKINARLCVMMGSIMQLIIRENVHVPGTVRLLHLDRVYSWIVRIPYSNFWRRRIFRRKMDNYNSKKLLTEAGAEELSGGNDEMEK